MKPNNLILSLDTGEGFKPVAVIPNYSNMDAENMNKVLHRSTLSDEAYFINIFHEHFTIESIGGKV